MTELLRARSPSVRVGGFTGCHGPGPRSAGVEVFHHEREYRGRRRAVARLRQLGYQGVCMRDHIGENTDIPSRLAPNVEIV
jgi:hypothetical protein